MRIGLSLLLLVLAGCTCENRILNELPSPDGRRKVVAFDRGCGATTGYSLQLSVLPRNSSTDDAGNAFIVDAEHGSPIFDMDLTSLVRVAWVSPTQLLVVYDPRLRVSKQQQRVRGVTVRYDTLSQK